MKRALTVFLLALIIMLTSNNETAFQAAETKELERTKTYSTVSPASELAVGDEFTVSNITYCVTSVSPTLEVEAYYAPMRLTTITIPGTVTYNNVTYAVTSIPNGAFFDNYKTTKIIISEGVKNIGTSAFQGCDAVTSIELPSTLESFTTMGFKSLETITLASGNQHFKLIDGILFAKDGTKLWLYPSGKAGTSYNVPDGTTTIGDSAFYGNQYLQSITLPDSVTKIESYAFDSLQSLKSMTFGENISSVREYNLSDCPKLTSVILQNSGKLGNYCIYNCGSLENVVIDGQLNGYGMYALYNLPNLKMYEVQNSHYYTSKDGVLYGETKLLRYPSGKTDILYVVPDETTTIASLAFNYMQHTKEVVLNPKVNLDVMAFHHPNPKSPMEIYFRDKENVSLSTSTSGVFVGLTGTSRIYLPTKTALQSFNTFAYAVNPTNSTIVEIGIIPSTELTLNKTSTTVKRNETFSLAGTLTPYYSTDDITWTSSNESIATVSATGVIKGVGAGECIITATTDSGIKKTCIVSVSKTDISTLNFADIANPTYTGLNITPQIIINEGISTLVEGADYTASFENNVNAGTATVTIAGLGNYKGTKILTFNILPKDATDTIVSAITAQTYTGSAVKPSVTVKDGSTTLVNRTDYTVAYENNVNAGTATVTLTFKGNYSGIKDVSFAITPKSADSLTITDITNQTYTGSEIKPNITVKDGSITLVTGTDYTVSYKNNVNAGTATVTLIFKGNYTGTKDVTFTINPKSADSLAITDISNQTYTGSAIKPIVIVKDGSTTLVEGTDYTVTYKNNVNAGTATVTISFKGNYTGTKEETFTITPKPADSLTITDITNQTYTGSEIEPIVTTKDGSTTLVEGTDYTITYENNVNAGTATAIVTLKGNYSGTRFLTFRILPKDAANVTVSTILNQTYSGSAIKPSVTVKDGSVTLVNGTDYTVAYENNVNAGTATVTLTFKGNYTGTKEATFAITPKPADSLTITDITNQTYTGSEIEPNVSAKDGSTTLAEGTDYTVTYKNNVNTGTATVTISFKGNYTGTKEETFIITPKSAEEFTFSTIPVCVYNGLAIEPEVSVIDEKKILVKDVDYTISYKNNVNVGTATVIISGVGNYTGTKTITFSILPKELKDVTVSAIANQIYTGSAIEPNVIVKDSTTTLTNGTDYTVCYENNVNAGTATVYITFKGMYSGNAEVHFTISPKPADNFTAADIANHIYTGLAIEPGVIVKDDATTLVNGTDYTVSYKNNVNAGTATVTISYKGNYTGTKEVTFTITPKSADNLAITDIANHVYTGSAIEPSVTVKDGSTTLVEGTDYTVSHKNNVNAGTATVTISFKGNYAGTKEVTFTITPKLADGLAITDIENQTYTGSAIEPNVTVKDGSITLVEGTDYTITYENNVNAGTATVYIVFKGKYSGNAEVHFTISPKPVDSYTTADITNHIYTGSAIEPIVTVKDGSTTLIEGTDYTVAYENNVNAGTATATLTFKGNYAGTKEVTFTISPKPADDLAVADIENQTYTGSEIKPNITVKDGTTTLVNGTDYTVSYKNNVNAGTATVTISFKGNYSGTKTVTFSIVEKSPTKPSEPSAPTKITSSSLSVNETLGCISKISIGTTVNSFRSSLNEMNYVSVYKDNQAVSNSSVLGTGMNACLMNGNTIVKKYSIVVTGDVNGDGKMNITDMIAIKANILKKSSLSGTYAKAGDVNGDGKINVTDFIKIKATLLKKDTITGVAVK